MDLFAAYTDRPMVSVEIGGQPHVVPEGVTVLQAMWYSGIPVVKGAGCLGGVCGACTTTWRMPGDLTARSGLGCQIAVREGMSFTLYPVDAPQKPRYRMAELDDPAEALFSIYPETRRCTLCDSCTQVCPQGITVKSGVMRVMNKMFEPVAPMFDECVMCNMCSLVCEVGIAPNLLGLYARKAVARERPAPPELETVMRRVADGKWDAEWGALLEGSGEALAGRCRAVWERDASRD
ncbi:MAG: 4Fe-4S ferredoxin [Nitrospirota bacterium]|nr:4Fe-4S ferredoxin [Nitrospirota bacterium]